MKLNLTNSFSVYKAAKKYIPGGVNSPVRAFNGVDGNPVFFEKAKGAYLYDIDGNEYLDYVGSWGPMIFGHNYPPIVNAVTTELANAMSFGAPTLKEIELAKEINKIMPSIEMVRMVNSGTEASMSALRLARGFTGRNKIIKFAGCYHGHADSLLVQAGSGILTLGIPGSPGVPPATVQDTLVAKFNDLDATKQLFAQHGQDIAAVIFEPIPANANMILPKPGFIPGLQELCQKYNSILIADEVITGFRVALGGAQELYGFKADLTCLGKIIGGGMPVGAFGGRKDIMEYLAPIGPVYQAGTLSGNPIAVTAGLTALKELQKPGTYQQLNTYSEKLMQSFAHTAEKYQLKIDVRYEGGLFGFSFENDPELKLFKKFYHYMLEQCIYLAPSAFEAGFVSLAHSEKELQKTVGALDYSFANLV